MQPWEVPSTGPAAALVARIAEHLPRLETERLVLRAPRIEDGPVYCAIFLSDRWPHDDVPTEEDAWLDFNFLVASWLLRGFGIFAVEDKATGALLGFVALDHEFGDPEREIGWMLCPEAEGRGIATEAGRALLTHAAALGIRPVAYAGIDNPRSMGVAERIGGQRDAALEAEIGDEGLAVYRFPEARP